MKLNINQKSVLMLNLIEFMKSVYGPNHPLPEPLRQRGLKIMNWLSQNVVNNQEELVKVIDGMPPPEANESYGAVDIGSFELADAIAQLMEGVIEAELSPDRIPEPAEPPRRLIRGRMRDIRRQGRNQRKD